MFICTIASVGIALGVLWEVVELVVAELVTLELGHPRAETRFDTVLDLIMDTAGALLAAILIYTKVPAVHKSS